MDCNYIQQNEIHEKYLLNQLTEAEKTEYKKHIEECSSCREKLQNQTEIIQGIREIGFQEMKSEIQRQAEEVKTQKKTADWQMILKVAAVLFIIAIIPTAVFYFQTEPGKPMSQLLKSEPSTPANETITLDKNQVTDESKTNDKIPQPSPKGSEQFEKTAKREKQYRAEEIPEEDQLKNSSDIVYGRAGEGYAAAETKGIEEMSDSDSIFKKKEAAVAKPQRPIAVKAGKESLLLKLSEGITYHYAGTELEKEKSANFETQEKTAIQQYDAVTSKKLGKQNLPKNGIKGFEGKFPLTSKAVFEAGEKQISINFFSADRDLIIDQESKLPQSFDVQIIDHDSLNWKMNWFINQELLKYDHQQIKMVINKTKLYSIILDDYIYEIDLTEDSTKAVLMK